MDITTRKKEGGIDISKNTDKIGDEGGRQFPDAPFVSVMVLDYNYGNVLGRALEACAAQTFRDFDIVMINNGSTDNSEQVFRDFCAKHPEIKTNYVHVEQNQGITHGWNAGLRHARGEYVMFHDADDWMEPDCLECLAKKAAETGADRVSGPYRFINDEGQVLKERLFTDKVLFPTFGIQSVIFRRSVIENNRIYFPEENNVDAYQDFWYLLSFAVCEKNHGVNIVDHIVYNYRVHSRSYLDRGLKDDLDWLINKSVLPFIKFSAAASKKTSSERLRQEIEYGTVRFVYSTLAYIENFNSASVGRSCKDAMFAELNKEFPSWDKNPILWPFGNGLPLFESTCLYALFLMDKLHATWMIRLAGKMSRFVKFRR